MAADVKTTVLVLAAYVFLAGAYFGITYEKTRELIPAISVLLAATCAVLLWNRGLARRSARFAGLVSLAHAMSVQLSVLFLVFYHFHYLYLFGV